MGNTIQKLVVSDPFPESYTPTYDSHFGFSQQRKERVMIAKEEDLIAAKVPKKFRDYCAHLYLDYMRCRRRVFPWVKHCAAEKYNYQKCEYDDFVLRMKEYERERRLLIRDKVKKEGAMKAMAA